MTTKIFLLLLGGLGMLIPKATGQSVAPTVLATSGSTASDDQIQVAWTLGEPIIQTAGMVTQGFQGTEAQVVSSTKSLLVDGLVLAFPNPVDRLLTLQFKGEKPRVALQAVVWNALSQQMLVVNLTADSSDYTLDCSSLTPGAYWLDLRDQQGIVVNTVSFVKR